MPVLNADSHVLIIGGGIAGFGLAQSLRKAGISYQVFERDVPDTTRFQGWAIALIECLPGMVEFFPTDIGDVEDHTSVVRHLNRDAKLAVVNAKTAETVATLGGPPKGEPGHVVRANRLELRQHLSQKSNVSWGKQFSHYVDGPDGVTAYFKDGTSAHGNLLVGADGAHSHVRQELLRGAKARPTAALPIVGEVTLSAKDYAPLQEISSNAFLAQTDEILLMVGLRSLTPDLKSADYYWVCVDRAKTMDGSAHRWVQEASKRQLFDRVREMTRDFHPVLTDVIGKTGVEGMREQPFTMNEFSPPEFMPRGNVTLVGDALHTMPPFAGAGANTALMDVFDLTRELKRGIADGKTLDAVLEAYDATALPRAREAVTRSLAAGKGDGSRKMVSDRVGGKVAKSASPEQMESVAVTNGHQLVTDQDGHENSGLTKRQVAYLTGLMEDLITKRQTAAMQNMLSMLQSMGGKPPGAPTAAA